MASFPIATFLRGPAWTKGCSGCTQQAQLRWTKDLCLFQHRWSYKSEREEALGPPEEEPPPSPALPAVSIEEEETKVLFLRLLFLQRGTSRWQLHCDTGCWGQACVGLS